MRARLLSADRSLALVVFELRLHELVEFLHLPRRALGHSRAARTDIQTTRCYTLSALGPHVDPRNLCSQLDSLRSDAAARTVAAPNRTLIRTRAPSFSPWRRRRHGPMRRRPVSTPGCIYTSLISFGQTIYFCEIACRAVGGAIRNSRSPWNRDYPSLKRFSP
jgi:hypothetical protein